MELLREYQMFSLFFLNTFTHISKKDAPMFFATIKAYSHTVADLLDEGEKVPLLDINNGGKYFTDKSIEDYRVLK